MTKLTRKLLLSIITVVLTVVALGTTTFAWFTLTNTASVQTFEADIVADSGIEIALGDSPQAGTPGLGLNWVTTLTTQSIYDYIDAKYGTFTFNHLTTTDGDIFRTLGVGSQGAQLQSGLLEINIHFRSNSANAIDWTAVSLNADDFTWNVDQAFDAIAYDGGTSSFITNPVTSGDTLLLNAADAFRIAILGNVGGASNVVAYERPESTTAPYNIVLGTGGDLSGTLFLDPDTVPGSGDEVYTGTYGAHSYFFNDSQTSPYGIDNVVTLATQTSIAQERILDMVDTNPDAGATYYGTATIKIWLEGWDLNAYNSLLSQTVRASFQFTGVEI
jgi:hypothetical protein